MEKRISNGSEVLIFHYVGLMGPNQDNYHFKRGVVESSTELDELTLTGDSNKKRYYYTVVGEDGQKYYGNYGKGNIGSSVFRTEKDYKKFLLAEIKRLEENKAQIDRQLDYLLGLRDKLLEEAQAKRAKQTVQKTK